MKYTIQKKNIYELKNHYDIRKKIITFLEPKNKKDLIYYENLSYIFINMIFLKNKYNKDTEKIIYDIIKKINNKNILLLHNNNKNRK